jgi:hypothetical protein
MNPSDQVPDSLLEQALEQLQSAIALLDCAGAPGQIAAHIDLAVNQLRDIVSPPQDTLSRLQAGDEDRQTISSLWLTRPN